MKNITEIEEEILRSMMVTIIDILIDNVNKVTAEFGNYDEEIMRIEKILNQLEIRYNLDDEGFFTLKEGWNK